jgi:23S rRNA pseudouridine1911/1915/1917 synthase
MPTTSQLFTVTAEMVDKTVAAGLRHFLPGTSWSQARALIDGRRVRFNGELWLDEVRRLKIGDQIEILSHGVKAKSLVDQIVLRHVDEHLVVVEKPAGISTVRHPSERDWLENRRLKVPTLDDLVLRQLGEELPTMKHHPRPKLRIVHRLDKETSGLVVFARTVPAERGLGVQFKDHTVTRRYYALAVGNVKSQTHKSSLVRDRGDGRRGSTKSTSLGKTAITHIETVEKFRGFTLVSCRLETGRTHQIRIHLAESGHPVCGEQVYNRPLNGAAHFDASGTPRLFLHATELGFQHPITGEAMHWDQPLPPDLVGTIERLRLKTAQE